jgi:hypothetical protein
VRLAEAPRRLWRWIESDPRNLALLTLPLTLAGLVHQVRWLRSHEMGVLSVRGGFAYIRAHPRRTALTLLVTTLPDVVAAALRRRSS